MVVVVVMNADVDGSCGACEDDNDDDDECIICVTTAMLTIPSLSYASEPVPIDYNKFNYLKMQTTNWKAYFCAG